MPDSVIQPEEQQKPVAGELSELINEPTASSSQPVQFPETTRIIWTPRFMVGFALLLVLGLSVESALASAWNTHVITGDGLLIILGHLLPGTAAWLGLAIVARSQWTRIGAISGLICAIFLTLDAFAIYRGMNTTSLLQSYFNVAACLALFGASLGLSIEGLLETRWDHLIYFLLPALGGLGVLLTYLLTPQHSLMTVENAVATAALIAACLIWWARPTCWRLAPGPAFLFGIVPVVQMLMAQVNGSMHSYFLLQILNPTINSWINLNNFFFAEMILLALLLGCLRLIKGEITP